MDDIFNNRFKGYQNSADIAENITNVHANLYKSISWVNANYDTKKVESLANEQRSILTKNIENIKKIIKEILCAA